MAGSFKDQYVQTFKAIYGILKFGRVFFLALVKRCAEVHDEASNSIDIYEIKEVEFMMIGNYEMEL